MGCLPALTSAFCSIPSIEQATLTRQVRNDARLNQAIERHASSIPIPARIAFGPLASVVCHLQAVNGLPSLTARRQKRQFTIGDHLLNRGLDLGLVPFEIADNDLWFQSIVDHFESSPSSAAQRSASSSQPALSWLRRAARERS